MTGNRVSIKTKPIQDGHAVFSPIKDDMIRTVHTKPQVCLIYFLLYFVLLKRF